MTENEPFRNPYAAPEHEGVASVPGKNPTHTVVFAVLFLLMLVSMFVLRGLVGLVIGPVIGAALFGLYRLTLPSEPKRPGISETAGTTPCPNCGSLQTDRRREPMGRPPWQCFACDHEW